MYKTLFSDLRYRLSFALSSELGTYLQAIEMSKRRNLLEIPVDVPHLRHLYCLWGGEMKSRQIRTRKLVGKKVGHELDEK